MKQSSALFWKEWRQGRVFFSIALAIFLLFPFLEEVEYQNGYNLHRHEIQTSPWVISCAGIFAVFTAIGMTCPDFRGRLSDFWRSRPLEMRAWLSIKYLVGLMIVLLPCIVALKLELLTSTDKSASNAFYLGPFQWLAIYSVAFAIGCTIRRPAPAAMLSLGAMLLIYFLPTVLPPLSWLDYQKVSYLYTVYNSPNFVFGKEQIIFATGMIGIAIIAFIESQYVWRQGVNLPAGPKVMYGSVASAVLLLMLSATFFFRQGTNLTQLDFVKLPDNEQMRFSGVENRFVSVWLDGQPSEYRYQHPISVEGNSIRIGAVGRYFNRDYSSYAFLWPNNSPEYLCDVESPTTVYPGDASQPASPFYDLVLSPIHVDAPPHIIHLFESTPAGHWPYASLYSKENNIYVMVAGHALTVDVSDLDHAKVIQDIESQSGMNRNDFASNDFTCHLPDIPELSDDERLMASLHVYDRQRFQEGLLCVTRGGRDDSEIVAFRLMDKTSRTAHFHAVASYKLSSLKKVMARQNDFSNFSVSDGLLYLISQQQAFGNPVVDVFEMRGQHPLTHIAYFAAPDAWRVFPLADGRSIVTGNKTLYLVAAPKRAPGLEHP